MNKRRKNKDVRIKKGRGRSGEKQRRKKMWRMGE
jgi:hypothetical protein